MGLDMYAYVTDETPDGNVDFEVGSLSELHYWRKHPNLHGWMEKLYSDLLPFKIMSYLHRTCLMRVKGRGASI